MATNIVTALKTRSPVRNEVPFGVEGTTLIDQEGQLGFSAFIFNGIDLPNEGDSLDIYYDPDYLGSPGGTCVLMFSVTFTATPDTSGTQVLLYTGGSFANWLNNELIPVLQSNYWLNTNFVIGNYSDGGPSATAREFGNWNVLWINVGSWTTSFYDSDAGEARIFVENAGLLFQVWVEDGVGSNDYKLRLTEVYPADENGEAEIDVADVVRAYLAPHMPEPDMDGPVEMTRAWTHFYITSAERFNFPPEFGPLATSPIGNAYLAGRSEDKRINFPSWDNQLLLPGFKWRFLTSWPNTTSANAKTVVPSQREFLSVIFRGASLDDMDVIVAIEYTDGTTTSVVLDSVISPVAAQLYMFAVGIEARDLDDIMPTKTIHRYNVHIKKQADSTIFTETRYYIVDNNYHEHVRQLHYFNSQGGVDTVALFGERVNKPEADMLKVERSTRGSDTFDEARNEIAVLRTMQDNFEVGTAYFTLDELAAMKDLPASESIVERVGTKHWPVSDLSMKGPDTDEGRTLAAYQVKYRHAFRNTALSE